MMVVLFSPDESGGYSENHTQWALTRVDELVRLKCGSSIAQNRKDKNNMNLYNNSIFQLLLFLKRNFVNEALIFLINESLSLKFMNSAG